MVVAKCELGNMGGCDWNSVSKYVNESVSQSMSKSIKDGAK